MNILICPDKFKYTFTAAQIAGLINDTISNLGHRTLVVPLSDGGEGFLEVIASNLITEKIPTDTLDPLWRKMQSFLLWDRDNKTAYIELAQTGSLQLLKPQERNPLNTTTFGLGLQIRQAIRLGAEKIFIGLGGSSTTDMGVGMAAALGYRFFDWQHNVLVPIGRNLLKVQYIDVPPSQWPGITACVDVANPLYGSQGAAFVYSPQKGANPEAVLMLDRGLRNMAHIVHQDLNITLNTTPGEGAAGGLGAGIKAFLNGTIRPGTDIVFTLTQLEEKIHWADIVITGEGSFDRQSLQGKATGRVIDLARQAKKTVIVIAGQSRLQSYEDVHILSLFDKGVDMDTARRLTPQLIKQKLTLALKQL